MVRYDFPALRIPVCILLNFAHFRSENHTRISFSLLRERISQTMATHRHNINLNSNILPAKRPLKIQFQMAKGAANEPHKTNTKNRFAPIS